MSEWLTLGRGCCASTKLSRSVGTRTHFCTCTYTRSEIRTHIHPAPEWLICQSMLLFPAVSPPLFPARFLWTETRACKIGACVSLFHHLCLICAIRAHSKHFPHNASVAQLKCRTLLCGIQSPYSTWPPYTTVSFHSVSISLQAGLMMAARRELAVEKTCDYWSHLAEMKWQKMHKTQ